MTAPINPYAPPTAMVDDVMPAPPDDAEAIRKLHLSHEASITAIGSLYYLSAIFLALGSIFSVVMPPTTELSTLANLMVAGVVMAMAGGLFSVAYGLSKLRPWVFIPAMLLSVIGLLGFPIGTLLNAYIIWLLVSKKGRMVLSPEYALVVAATPQIKYQTSMIIRVFLGLLLLLIVVLILAAIFVP